MPAQFLLMNSFGSFTNAGRPGGTFWGIATGISVMLLCFGPGVFFLFAERCRKLKPRSAATNGNP